MPGDSQKLALMKTCLFILQPKLSLSCVKHVYAVAHVLRSGGFFFLSPFYESRREINHEALGTENDGI